jgi:hypothetical protein
LMRHRAEAERLWPPRRGRRRHAAAAYAEPRRRRPAGQGLLQHRRPGQPAECLGHAGPAQHERRTADGGARDKGVHAPVGETGGHAPEGDCWRRACTRCPATACPGGPRPRGLWGGGGVTSVCPLEGLQLTMPPQRHRWQSRRVLGCQELVQSSVDSSAKSAVVNASKGFALDCYISVLEPLSLAVLQPGNCARTACRNRRQPSS